MKESKHIYTLELTERQAKLLSYACDQYTRCIQGQDNAFQELFEAAWEKRCKEAVGGHGMDKEWDGGWYKMREDAENFCKQIKKRFWGLGANELQGIRYDDTADILYDIHRVLRHQFYKDRGDTSISTVDAENPTSSIGTEPLARVKNTNTIWHDCDKELPENRRNVIATTMSPKGRGVMEGGVTIIADRGLLECDKKGTLKKWAYLDDILPK